MSFSVSQAKILLRQILDQLVRHEQFTRPSGTGIDDPAHFRELEELERLSVRLSLIVRELQSRSNLLTARQNNIRKVPHETRFTEQASIQGQQFEVSEALKLAAQIQELLESMLRKSGLMSTGEMAENIGKFIEKAYKEFRTHGEVSDPGGQLEYRPIRHEMGIEWASAAVFMALSVYIRLRRRSERKNNQT